MGKYDVPACVAHVLSVTKQYYLHYVGHSQGKITLDYYHSSKCQILEKVQKDLRMREILVKN